MTAAVVRLVRERTEAVATHTSERFSSARTQSHIAVGTTSRDFLAAVALNPRAPPSTGVIYGVHIENVTDELAATISRLYKAVAESRADR